jgi:general secretion pathway protein F
MPQFRYSAISTTGELLRGVMEATDEAAVVAALRRQGQTPVRARPIAGGGARTLLDLRIGRAALGAQGVANFTRELAVMLSAGQDLDRALRFVAESGASARARQVVDGLRNAVRDGSAFATALARYPDSFSRLYVGIVRAGESGGTLGPTLDRLAGLLERQRALAAAIKSALVYPIILTIAAIGSIALLLTQVLPQFVPLFEQNGAALPAATQTLIDLGNVVSAYGLYGLVVMAALVAGTRMLLRVPRIRLLADRAVLRLPVVGSLVREILAARFCRSLGTLLQNGVPLIGVLGIVRDVVGNHACAAAISAATESAKNGAGLARPLAEARIFPLRTIYLLRLGEETGQLADLALRAAEIHEERSRISLQRLVSLLTPTITIVMAMAVAGIVVSLLTAMLSLNDLAGS